MVDKNNKIDPFTVGHDEFTTSEEKERSEIMKQAALLIQAHNDLMNQIGVNNLIDKIKELIDSSDSFQFRSEMARDIDEEVPLFIMSLRKNVYTEHEGLTDKLYESKMITLIQNEIIKPSGEILNKYLEENGEEFKEFNEKYGVDTKNMLMSNIFGVIIANYSENNIQLRIIV